MGESREGHVAKKLNGVIANPSWLIVYFWYFITVTFILAALMYRVWTTFGPPFEP
jgi:hypothetical protein